MRRGIVDLHLQPDGVYGLGTSIQLGAVNDYDTIKIGGKVYTTNQLLDKTVVAAVDTKTYSRPGGTVLSTVKAGQTIGKVYSYIKASSPSSDGRAWLMFESTYNNFYYVPDENVSGSGLKDQGTLTVAQEKKVEDDAKLKEESPVEYYLKKYGTKVLLFGGAIIVAVAFGKEFIKGAMSQKKESAPALAGKPKRKKSTRRKSTKQIK